MQLNKWWESGALTKAQGFISGWSLNEVKVEDVPMLVQKYADTGCNFVHVPIITIGKGCGSDPKGFHFMSKTEPNNNADLLSPMVEEFHKQNIKVICYFNGHSFVPEFYEMHPDWVMINEDGKPLLTVYGTGASACPNNKEYREWQANVIKDMCQYDIDGVFLDGDIFFAKACYCKTCREQFRQRYNKEMPPKSMKKHPDWRLLRQFQIESLTSYVERLYKALKSIRPQALLYCNAALRSPNWTTGRQNRKLIQVQDMLLSEGGFLYGDLNKTPIWRLECETKLCVNQSEGKPVISGMAMDHKGWNWYQLPMAESRLMMYSAIASGGNASAATSSIRNNVDKVIENLKGVFDFINKNSNTFYPTTTLSKVAVAWSNVNADYYKGGSVRRTDFTGNMSETEAGDLHLEFEGFYDVCFRKHIPSDVIDEISIIDGSLNKYDVVILPNMACMTDEEMDCIREYVKAGGTIISTFETSLYNEYGEKRQDFGLADMFGCKLSEENIFGPLTFDYVMPTKAKNSYSDLFSGYIYLPISKYMLKTSPDTAECILDCAELMEGRYDGFPERSKNGFMYMNNYGKGKSFYFAGTMGQALIEWHFFEHFDIIGKTLSDNTDLLAIIIDGPESISLNIRKNMNTNEVLIYLTNFTGSMTRPVRRVCTLNSIKLKTGLPFKHARALMSEDNIKVEENGDEHLITIKKLEEFEVIALT